MSTSHKLTIIFKATSKSSSLTLLHLLLLECREVTKIKEIWLKIIKFKQKLIKISVKIITSPKIRKY